jgi:hypothetical protein
MFNMIQTGYNPRGATVNGFLYMRVSIYARTRECEKE